MSDKLSCCVCNSEENVHVVSSMFGPMSDAYCMECVNKGKDKYEYMVAYYSLGGTKMSDFNEHFQKIAIIQCELHNKTIEEFEKDLKKSEEDFMKYYEENPDYLDNDCDL